MMKMNFQFADFSPRIREVGIKDGGEIHFTFGKGSYLVSGIMASWGHVLMGNYCSLAGGVEFNLGRNHTTQFVTTYPFDVIDRDGNQNVILDGPDHVYAHNRLQIILGSDVWIGTNATIMGGAKIGVGACVGTNALVTGEVPPYAIVGGVPARVIKYRFPQEIIDKLLAIKWWHWDINKIHDNYELMKNVEAFCNRFYPEALAAVSEEKDIAKTLKKMRASGVKVYYMYADFGRQNPAWKNVLNQFLDMYDDKSPCALIFEVVNPDNTFGELDIIVNKLKERGHRAPQVFIHSESTEQAAILRNMDCFITTREAESILGVDYAWECGAQIVSGLDSGLFATS